MIRCKTCVMPNTRPDTPFIDGECSACISYRKRAIIDWSAREKALLQLLDENHGECIVASSGGKDSHYIGLKLLELGAHVTCVTATTCQLTPIGRENIDNLARYVPTLEYTPNRRVRAILNRLGLQLVGDISWPEHVSIFTTPFRMAEALGRHLIFYGENPQEAYGGPQGTDAAFELTARWRSEFGGFLGLRPSDLVGQEGITERDMADYEMPKMSQEWSEQPHYEPGMGYGIIQISKPKVKAYFLGQFYPWDSWRNADVASEHGFRYRSPGPMCWWPFENQDNYQTGIHDYLMFRKFGYGRGCAQISVDVRAGKVTRERALAWVEKCDGLLPDPYCSEPLSAVLDHIGMPLAEFNEVVRRFTR